MNEINDFRNALKRLRGTSENGRNERGIYYVTQGEYNQIVGKWPEVATWSELRPVDVGLVM